MNGLTEPIPLLPSRHSQTSHDRHHGRLACRRQARSIASSASVSSAIRTYLSVSALGRPSFGELLTAPLPSDGPIGEAWLLSDRDDHQSHVADGPLKGRTIGQLLEQFPEQMLGQLSGRFRRFPLLLKFLDVHEMLSVQVHPTKANTNLLPAGETPKTEAWVVLEAGTQSRIYAGLRPDTTEADLRRALTNGTVADHLAWFTPKPGDAVFLRLVRFTLWAATLWCSRFSRTAT
jgi:hypothetical protein